MAITPEMISEKSFSTKFKGYNMDEVDDFLDYVMDEVDKLLRENSALKEGDDHEKLVKLTAELEATRSKVKQLEAGAAEPVDNAELIGLRNEVTNLQRRNAELEAGSVDTAELNSLRSQLMAAKAQIAELESQPVGLPSMEVDNLKAQLEQREAELRAAHEEIAELRNKPAANEAVLEAANKKAQQIIADASVRSDFMIKDAETQTRKALAAMRVEVDEAQKEFENLRVQMREVRNRYLITLQNQLRVFDNEENSSEK